MASINSLPPEVTAIIIARTATSGDEDDEYNFEKQLTLTARISSNWTTLSQELLHSDISFSDDEQANKWLECGIAGIFKTKRLILDGLMEEKAVEGVMKKVTGLERIFLALHSGAFDMKLLQGERFSNLKFFTALCALSFEGRNKEPFKFRLSSLSIHEDCICSPELFDALISSSRPTLRNLVVTNEELMASSQFIIKLEESPRIEFLYLHSRLIPTLAPLRELETFHTFTGNDEAELDHLEFILSTIAPGQLKQLMVTLDSDGQIEEDDLESVARMMKLPGLNRLERLIIEHEGDLLIQMTQLRAEWEKRGISVTFWGEDIDRFENHFDNFFGFAEDGAEE